MIMSISKNDEPQVIAMPRANSHSIEPNWLFVSALASIARSSGLWLFAECEFFIAVYYSRRWVFKHTVLN